MTNTQKVKDSILEILKKELEYQNEGYNKIKIARGSEKDKIAGETRYTGLFIRIFIILTKKYLMLYSN